MKSASIEMEGAEYRGANVSNIISDGCLGKNAENVNCKLICSNWKPDTC